MNNYLLYLGMNAKNQSNAPFPPLPSSTLSRHHSKLNRIKIWKPRHFALFDQYRKNWLLLMFIWWWFLPPNNAGIASRVCLFGRSDGQHRACAVTLVNFQPIGWLQGHMVLFPRKCQSGRSDRCTVDCHRSPSLSRKMHSNGNIAQVI